MHQVAVRGRVRWHIGAGIRAPCLTALGSSVRNDQLSMSGTDVLLSCRPRCNRRGSETSGRIVSSARSRYLQIKLDYTMSDYMF
jgi:hypothetical protein